MREKIIMQILFRVFIFIWFSFMSFNIAYCASEDLRKFTSFLQQKDYISGGTRVAEEDKLHIKQQIVNIEVDELFRVYPYFAANIAFVAAQVNELDKAAAILMKLHEKDHDASNWLFEELREKGVVPSELVIKRILLEVYQHSSENKQRVEE